MSGYGGNYDFNSQFNVLYGNGTEQSSLNNTNGFDAFLNSIQGSSAAGNGGSAGSAGDGSGTGNDNVNGVDVYGQHHQQLQQQRQPQPPQQQNYQYNTQQHHHNHHHQHLQQPSYNTGTNGLSQNMFYQDSSLSGLLNNMNSGTSSSVGGGPASAPAVPAATLGTHGSTAGNDYMPAPSVAPPASAGYMLHQPLTYDSTTMDYFALLQQQQTGQQQQPRQPPKQPQHYDFNRESAADFEKWSAAPLPTTQKASSSQNQNSLSNVNNGSFGTSSSNDIADFAQNFFDPDCSFDSMLDPLPQKKSNINVNSNAMGSNLSLSATMAPNELDVIDTISNMSQYNPSLNQRSGKVNSNRKSAPQNDIFAGFIMNIISLSQEPLSAHEIIEKISFRCDEVVTRFLPCVEFLVACQQELRAGLAMVVQKNGRGRSIFSAQEFYKTYFEPLTLRFYNRNKSLMPSKELKDSYDGIKKLLQDVKKNEQKGNFEGMKNSFLGGMRDGESWGLRKWLSKNGGALKICNDIELIWGALRDLNREEATTKELARILRPKAKHALKRLQEGVPKAYQEVSTAHPYLPFFHRLECALKGLSEFDPEEDGVICIDDSESEDDEVQEIKVVEKPVKQSIPKDLATIDFTDCETDLFKNPNTSSKRSPCDENYHGNTKGAAQLLNTFGISSVTALLTANKFQLASSIDEVASAIEAGNEIRPPNINFDEYWTRPNNYIIVLRLFQKMLLESTADHLLDHTSQTRSYVSLLKNPLCFRDIVLVISQCKAPASHQKKGHLPTCPNLKRWNMFEGKYLIQAVDLVFLNNLAILGKNPNIARSSIQNVRSNFWKEIRRAASTEKKCVPTRRTETSEFVIHK